MRREWLVGENKPGRAISMQLKVSGMNAPFLLTFFPFSQDTREQLSYDLEGGGELT